MFYLSRHQNHQRAANLYAFSFIKKGGVVASIGHPFYGGSGAPQGILSPARQIVPSSQAFSVLYANGSVRTWGSREAGGGFAYSPSADNPAVQRIFSTSGAFAAIRADGSVIAWGRDLSGGQLDKTGEKNPADIQELIGRNVSTLFAADNAFAALRGDGSVVAWPKDSYGGDASKVPGPFAELVSNRYAFAGITTTGGVKVWGSLDFGGELSAAVKASLSSGVKQIVATGSAFAALKSNGAVVAWGGRSSGGDPGKTIQRQLAGGVQSVYATESAFAAITKGGGVVAWGDSSAGGQIPDRLTGSLKNVRTIYASNSSFSAITNDQIISWGSRYAEGVLKIPNAEQIVDVVASSEAFAALTNRGQVLTWGKGDFGGRPDEETRSLLRSGVVGLQANYGAIAAIKSDGRLISWGDSDFGGKKGFDPLIRDVVSFG